MKCRFQFACVIALSLMLSAVMAKAQIINSAAQTITLNATLSDSLSVNLSGNAVNFTLTAGSASNPGNTGISSTTTWISKPGRNLHVNAYFATAGSALNDGFGNNIPSANFRISANGGAFAPLTNTVAFGGANAGVQLFTVKITGTNKTGNHTDNLLFNIDLSTLPNLPAGTYTGTLNIQAQII